MASRSEWIDVSVTSIRSGVDTTACKGGKPDAGSFGAFDVLGRVRDCTQAECGPWRELWRRTKPDLTVGKQNDVLWLTDDAGSYRTADLDRGVATTSHCTADTRCDVTSTGGVSCQPFQIATISPNIHTALDSDTCSVSGVNGVSGPRYTGTIGKRCVSLSGGVTKETTPTGTRETETVIVKSW